MFIQIISTYIPGVQYTKSKLMNVASRLIEWNMLSHVNSPLLTYRKKRTTLGRGVTTPFFLLVQGVVAEGCQRVLA